MILPTGFLIGSYILNYRNCRLSTTNSFLKLHYLLMMHVIKFLHVFLIWDMLSHACTLSGPSNYIQMPSMIT